MKKIKAFFSKIMPSKRKLIQLYAALLYNANLKGFITGKIYTGATKSVCLPGMNCYSCPGAVGACPLGSLQNALSESKTKAPTYVLGILLLYCIILGRTICGFFCPAGFLQELLYKIKTPKLKKSKFTRILSYFKYVLLIILVIMIPLIYGLQSHDLPVPSFCKYVCPVGTFEGAIFLLTPSSNANFFSMLGVLFTWKFILLIIFIIASIFIFRFFCRFFCPLGALYGIFNKLSILGIQVDKTKCNHCGACVSHCKMDVKEVGDHECIQCGECRSVCHCNAISWKAIEALIKEEEKPEEGTSKEKPKKNKRMIFGAITTIIMIATLIFAYIYYNVDFGKKVYNVTDTCKELTTKLYSDEEFNIKDNEATTILYFYDNFNEATLKKLEGYIEENIQVVAIGTYEKKDIDKDFVMNFFADSKIIFGYDSVNATAIHKFIEKEIYPYYVCLDNKDVVIAKQQEEITDELYLSIIYPSSIGKKVGKEIGDICINQSISIIGSDDKFSINANRGKITIINFWYSDCGPCKAELPHFNNIYKKYKDSVSVIAIHDANAYTLKRVQEEVAKMQDYEILFGFVDWMTEGSYYEALGGKSQYPMTFIIDQNGIIQYIHYEPITEEILEEEITFLL